MRSTDVYIVAAARALCAIRYYTGIQICRVPAHYTVCISITHIYMPHACNAIVFFEPVKDNSNNQETSIRHTCSAQQTLLQAISLATGHWP